MNRPLLFQQFSELNINIPWISLGKFPTPVERLNNIEKELGLNNLWIKRDDLSGELYGGNKVRTLEYSLAQAIQKQATLLLTYSALGSYWPLACMIYANLRNIRTNVIFLPYPLDAIKKKNLEFMQQFANQVYITKSIMTFPFTLYYNLYKLRKKERVFLMPPGGSSPTNILGFVNAIFELKEQYERGEIPQPDYIFCPLGSGGTVAGLSIGLSLLGWSSRVIAVRVVDLILANKFKLNHLIRQTLKVLKKMGCSLSNNRDWGNNIRVVHTCFGKGYSQPTNQGENCVKLFNEYENLTLDSTYTGKAFAAIVEMSKQGFLKNKVVLFWQTLNSRRLEIPEESTSI